MLTPHVIERAGTARRTRMRQLAAAGAVAALVLGAGTLTRASESAGAASQPSAGLEYDQVIQDVSKNPKDYVNQRGKKLKAPGGAWVKDSAWRHALAGRVTWLYNFDRVDAQHNRVQTIWVKDDGERRVAVTDVHLRSGYRVGWMTLVGRSGATPAQMRVANWFEYRPDLTRLTKVPRAGRSLIAVSGTGGRTPYATGFPVVTTAGVVRSTWHELSRVGKDLYLADLGSAGRLGWIYRLGSTDLKAPQVSSLDAFDEEIRFAPDRPKSLWETWAYAPFGGREHFTVTRTLTFHGPGDRKDLDVMTAVVRIGGTKTAGGGWLVTGDLLVTKLKGNPVTIEVAEVGDRAPLGLVAAPRPTTGGRPFVGLELPPFEDAPNSYVMVLATRGVERVRSGAESDETYHGLAVLDLRDGGRRTATGTPHQSVLLSGESGGGVIIARSRVHEPNFSTRDPDYDWPLNPHDGYPQTVIAWP